MEERDLYDFKIIRTDLETLKRLGYEHGYPNMPGLVDGSLRRLDRLQDRMEELVAQTG